MTDSPFIVLIEQEDDGGSVASVPALPGSHTQGNTFQEVLGNGRLAISLYIEASRDLGEPIPKEVGLEKVRVVA